MRFPIGKTRSKSHDVSQILSSPSSRSCASFHNSSPETPLHLRPRSDSDHRCHPRNAPDHHRRSEWRIQILQEAISLQEALQEATLQEVSTLQETPSIQEIPTIFSLNGIPNQSWVHGQCVMCLISLINKWCYKLQVLG